MKKLFDIKIEGSAMGIYDPESDFKYGVITPCDAGFMVDNITYTTKDEALEILLRKNEKKA